MAGSSGSSTNRWDLSNWTPAGSDGVSLFQALGINKGNVQLTQLTPEFSEQASSETSPANSGSDASGSTNLSGKLSYKQLEQLWVQAGGNPAYQAIAAAIAMAESGGNQDATDDDSNGTVDRGYWQINSSHGTQSTYDPLGNARAAVAISANGTNWNPWTTYTSGAYLQYMPANDVSNS